MRKKGLSEDHSSVFESRILRGNVIWLDVALSVGYVCYGIIQNFQLGIPFLYFNLDQKAICYQMDP